MKKLILLTGVLFIFLLTSCSSDSDDDGGIIVPPPTTITYTNTISGIVSVNCTSCHGNPPTNNAPMSLTTYDDVKNAVLNRGLITRIENGTMPPTGNLSASQIQNFKTWQQGGFIE